MPTNLLLLPLLGGYWFIQNFHWTRFRARRLDGYRLLVESAFYGLFFSCIAWIASRAAVRSLPMLAVWWDGATPQVPYLGTACLGLLFGIVSPYALNAFLGLMPRLTAQEARKTAIDRHGNDLLRLLHRANHEERLVSVTLDSRKVYIGALGSAPDLEPHETFFSMVPFFSGYRDASTLELVLTISYLDLAGNANVRLSEFWVVLPIASVRSASFFDQDAYSSFTVRMDDGATDPSAPNSVTDVAPPPEVPG